METKPDQCIPDFSSLQINQVTEKQVPSNILFFTGCVKIDCYETIIKQIEEQLGAEIKRFKIPFCLDRNQIVDGISTKSENDLSLKDECMKHHSKLRAVYPVFFAEQIDFMTEIPNYAIMVHLDHVHGEDTTEEQLDLEDQMRDDTDVDKKLKPLAEIRLDCGHQEHIKSSLAESLRFQILRTRKSDVRFPIEHMFLRISMLMRFNSTCRKQKVGCVIFKEKNLITVGWNGTPESKSATPVACLEGGCERCLSSKQGENLMSCLCMHAERRAILSVNRSLTMGATILTTLFPCNSCSNDILQCVNLPGIFKSYIHF